ncbi:AAA family ATPase [Pseudomonas sp. MS15a(2019)]|uniref:AAA family ATPase n=1 Tax=Pseudomonas TaxID=286 RepID=UPI001565D686|nr:hypothetical protein [Pseudomonas sp. MS15a(2019)]
MSQLLISALQNPALYPHPTSAFRVIETHISWVVLTGEVAYKIKKPVNFGFLDFTDLEARGHFCREELRLNQRLTRDLYQDVVAITGSEGAPELGGSGPVIEYALRMREFPQSQLLSEVQQRGELTQAHIDALAAQIARFHLSAPQVATTHPLCTPDAAMAPVRQNFEQIRAMLNEAADLKQLDQLEAWAEASYARLLPLFEARCRDGFIRECHGDIHLANATLLDGEVVLFDCIEFNEPFRLTDTMGDAGFLAMDLEDRGLVALSNRFVNAYFEATGDYSGLALLDFYKAYRAMVRAKIALFRLGQAEEPALRAEILASYRSYTALAEGYTQVPQPFAAVMHGVSGIGKSTVALALVEALGAIRLRSDVERQRLYADSDEATRYSAAAGEATYARLHEIGAQVLAAGYPLVLDATYLKQGQRTAAQALAEAQAAPLLIIDCQADDELIARWLQERQAEGTDPSEATLAVVAAQRQAQDPLEPAEQDRALVVELGRAGQLEALPARLLRRLGRAQA